MVTFLKLRVVFITLLFGLFGGALSYLLKIDEMQSYYPSLAALIALCVILMISFLIKAKCINSVFKYRDFNGDVSYYVKGRVYTEAAIKCRKDHPKITSDAAMMVACFESPEEKTEAWTEESINNNIFLLITSYCLVIIFFVGTVSLLTEILASKYTSKKS